MKKFNKKVAKKQEPVEEVESEEELEQEAASGDEEVEDEEEEDDDDDNLLDNEAEEDSGDEEEIDGEDGDEEVDGEEDSDAEEELGDEEDSEDEDENPLAPKKIPFNTPKVEAKEDLAKKFLEINGKRLYVRFPKRLPESLEELTKQLKSYCPLIKEVIKPRQKHANHCMVEFANKEDREKGLKKLSAVKIDDKNLVVKPPTMENPEKVEKAIENQQKKKKEKKMKQKLRKLAKKQAALTTSTLFITNIPPTATVADLKEHFPNAVDIKVKHTKDSQDTAKGSVTLPTPEDATKARKLKITIQDNLLHIKFDVSGKKQSWRAKQNKKFKTQKNGVAAPKDEGKKKPNKRPAVKKEGDEPTEKKVKTEPSAKKQARKPKTNKKKPVGVSA